MNTENRVDLSWMHLFKELIRSGDWGRMRPHTAKLYVVLKAYVNWQTGEAFPKIETLMEMAQISRHSVILGLRELEGMGLVRKLHGERERGRYVLVEKFGIRDTSDQPVAQATFDYLPANITAAAQAVKNFAVRGTMDGTPVNIHIDSLNLQIVQAGGMGAQNIGQALAPTDKTGK